MIGLRARRKIFVSLATFPNTFGLLRKFPEPYRSFPVQYRKNPNFSRNPNNNFPYINLYLRTILELLVTSGISSGTPNNIR